MTDCPQASESLSDYVDGLLEPAEYSALDEHLSACDECRGLVGDLMRLKETARSLGPIVPPAHIWENIQASLVPAASARRQMRAQWLALAAALVLVTAGAYFFTRFTAPASTIDTAHNGKSNVSQPATVETVEQELAKAAEHYERAIATLEALLTQDHNALPADAAAKLQVSLAQVDTFIAESRAALVTEPQSAPARDSLFTALRTKVEILQQSVALMGAMQRGDQAPAAPVIKGKKS